MHEHAIIADIINKAKSYKRPVEGIIVEVGDVAHLPLEELAPTLKAMCKGWNVKLTRKKAKIACECGYVGEPKIMEKGHDHTIYKCPKCQAMMPKVIEGADIILKEVSFA